MKLSIIVPVYNEGKTIDRVIHKIMQVELPAKLEREVIVVDDGSSDGTQQKVKAIKGVKKILRQKNSGKGAAVRIGLKEAVGDIVLIQDADLEYDPAYYPDLLKPILSGNTQIVYGTRLKNYPLNLWGNKKTVLPTHLIANKFLTFLTNILFNSKLTDMETCYKVFKKECLKGIILRSNGFEFEPEITIKFLKSGHRILEVPIKVLPRSYKEGKKINFHDGYKAIWTILKYRFTD